MMVGIVAAAVLAAAVVTAAPAAPPAGFVKPAENQKCPVCGMFVHKYPDWVAEVVFSDGHREVFDGAKDMFRYLADMRRFGGTRSKRDVAAYFVTDYYRLDPIDGATAWYVVGSDILGPMGRELIPFGSEADAREFLRDHAGKKILRAGEAERELPSLGE